MRKKDILELKKRFKKDDCTFTKMCGCYVNGEKNIILKFNETFLNIDEDEFFKYLEIAKKTLSGTIGNNLLQLEFPFDAEEEGGKQYDLMMLKKSCLKDDALLDKFYNNIIDNYEYTGNFLILLFHDAYDVITKTTDNAKLDESEEVFEYILCAICPVSLSKPGLSYLPDDNRIGARSRDWIVEPPANGFIFPAFIDRGSDIHSVIYYTKNARDTHPELMEGALGCSSKQTAAEQKDAFTNIIHNAVGSDDEQSNNLVMEIQDTLNTMIDDHNNIHGDDAEPVILTNNAISDLLVESGVPEEISMKIEKSYTEEFGETPPVAENLIDNKILAANEQRKKEKRLEKQVQILENKLKRTLENNEADSDIDSEINKQDVMSSYSDESEQYVAADDDTELSSDSPDLNSDTDLNSSSDEHDESEVDYDIVLQVKPEKVNQIKSQIIDGKKYLVIPVDDDEQANVNGVDTL
ncbi:MAG: DUF4317 family protein, partial [Clostridium sp.]